MSLLAFGDESFARFHAWQSILLTAFAGATAWGLTRVPLVGDALALAVAAATGTALLWLTAAAWRGRWTLLPLIGDLAAQRAR